MPASFTYPGVYVEEIPSGVHPITGVATSNTAFVDYFSQGPINQPVNVTSWSPVQPSVRRPECAQRGELRRPAVLPPTEGRAPGSCGSPTPARPHPVTGKPAAAAETRSVTRLRPTSSTSQRCRPGCGGDELRLRSTSSSRPALRLRRSTSSSARRPGPPALSGARERGLPQPVARFDQRELRAERDQRHLVADHGLGPELGRGD